MSRVTAKYQITLPVGVRKKLGIVPGCEVDIREENMKFVLVVNPVEEIKKKWRGKFSGGIGTDNYLNDIRGPAR